MSKEFDQWVQTQAKEIVAGPLRAALENAFVAGQESARAEMCALLSPQKKEQPEEPHLEEYWLTLDDECPATDWELWTEKPPKDGSVYYDTESDVDARIRNGVTRDTSKVPPDLLSRIETFVSHGALRPGEIHRFHKGRSGLWLRNKC